MSDDFCKRIAYDDYNGEAEIILGIIEQDDGTFLHVKTAKRQIMINKSRVISISPTTQRFKGVVE